MRSPATVVLVLAASACGSVHERVSQAFLTPRSEWLAEPSDLGLSFEEVRLDAGGSTLHGWFIPAADAEGRTVVLLHGNAANISFYHPYYTFLHDAGFNVFLYDYRGFGKSTGDVSVRALVHDFPAVMDWLRARPDVGPIAFYGISLGTVVALNAALRYRDVAGLVLEDAISPADNVRESLRSSGATDASTTIGTWGTQYFALPDDTEPDKNAARIDKPMLFLTGELESQIDRFATFRSYLEAKEPKALWVMPETGHAPHSLLTQDREYQHTVTRFLDTLFQGEPERLDLQWSVENTGAAGVWLDVTVERKGTTDTAPWALQLCAVDAEGVPSYHNVWLEGDQDTYRIAVPAEPGMVVAVRYHNALGSIDGDGWIRQRTDLARSGEVWARLEVDVDVMQNGQPDIATIVEIAGRIRGLEKELGPFHPLLESQLAGAFYWIGKGMLAGEPALQEEAQHWLRRCVAAAPERPNLHYWPGRPYVAGFPWGAQVEAARKLLAQSSPQ